MWTIARGVALGIVIAVVLLVLVYKTFIEEPDLDCYIEDVAAGVEDPGAHCP